MILFSGIKPSGALHLGSYVGAVSQWTELVQQAHHAYFSIVDLHAITVPQDPAILRRQTLDIAAWYMAAGLTGENTSLFIQSQNPDHTNLAWIFNCMISMGQLGRMTQYKSKYIQLEEKYLAGEDFLNEIVELIKIIRKNPGDKFNRYSDSELFEKIANLISQKYPIEKNPLGVGLFTYPSLMAADILLYGTTHVPVGEDQKQHVELARDIVEKFNHHFGDTFTLPEPVIRQDAHRIMSLQHPEEKMSKSSEDVLGTIYLSDDADTIRHKIKRATTDSFGQVQYDKQAQPGIANLLEIGAICSDKPVSAFAQECATMQYGTFKETVAEYVIAKLAPMRDRFVIIRNDEEQLKKVLQQGLQMARNVSSEKLTEVQVKVGFIT